MKHLNITYNEFSNYEPLMAFRSKEDNKLHLITLERAFGYGL